MPGQADEFAWIASLRPLTLGDERALDLADDAAILPTRTGFDLVVSVDAIVEGVHFPSGEAPDNIARKLLRTSLSDLAAKAATPFGYLMMAALPPGHGDQWREAFRSGLERDGREFAVALLGGDTVSTEGPLTLSSTVLGWVGAGKAVLRSGARDGDALVVCGDIGDGWLGLLAMRGEVADVAGDLARHYRLPHPLLALRESLMAYAHAAADVSDGLLADAGHVASASGLGVAIELDAIPLSAGALAWLALQADPAAARLALAVGGDDYALVCAVPLEQMEAFVSSVTELGSHASQVGVFRNPPGLRVTAGGRTIEPGRLGWRHFDLS